MKTENKIFLMHENLIYGSQLAPRSRENYIWMRTKVCWDVPKKLCMKIYVENSVNLRKSQIQGIIIKK